MSLFSDEGWAAATRSVYKMLGASHPAEVEHATNNEAVPSVAEAACQGADEAPLSVLISLANKAALINTDAASTTIRERAFKALVGSFPSSKMEECLSIMAETRCHEFATQLHTSPSLFGEVVVHSGHLEAMLLRGPHPPLSLVSGTLKVLQAIKLQLPGVGAPDEEAQLLLHWLLKLVEGEPKERLLKGLTHVALKQSCWPNSYPVPFGVVISAVISSVLEDPSRPCGLGTFDAKAMEMVILVTAPKIQSVAALNWAFLSEGRRCCYDMLVDLEQIREKRLPQVSQIGTPVFQELQRALPILQQFSVHSHMSARKAAIECPDMMDNLRQSVDFTPNDISLAYINLTWLQRDGKSITIDTFEHEFELFPRFDEESLSVTPEWLLEAADFTLASANVESVPWAASFTGSTSTTLASGVPTPNLALISFESALDQSADAVPKVATATSAVPAKAPTAKARGVATKRPALQPHADAPPMKRARLADEEPTGAAIRVNVGGPAAGNPPGNDNSNELEDVHGQQADQPVAPIYLKRRASVLESEDDTAEEEPEIDDEANGYVDMQIRQLDVFVGQMRSLSLRAAHPAAPVPVANLQLDAAAPPQGVNFNDDNEQPEAATPAKRRRVARVKGAAPTRHSERLRASRGNALPDAVAPQVPAIVPAAVVMPYVAPFVIAPVAVAPAVAAPAEAAPAADQPSNDDLQVDDEVDDDVVMQAPLPSRQDLVRLADEVGWRAFLTPLPADQDDVPDEVVVPCRRERRAAAKVCLAKNRYVAYARRPNLCEW